MKKVIFKYFRPLIRTPDLSKFLKNKGVLSQEDLLEEEYKYYFENKENKEFKVG